MFHILYSYVCCTLLKNPFKKVRFEGHHKNLTSIVMAKRNKSEKV